MKRNIIITGTTSGMGKCLTEMFSLTDNVIQISKSIDTNDIDKYQCDISNDEQVAETFAKISQKYNHIDILINNAGFGLSGATELIPMTEIRKIFDVNYFGGLNCIKNCIPLMSKGSKILNTSSVCAIFPLPYRVQYCASKSAFSMLSLGLRMELKSSGIQVCAICPGDTKTNFTKNRVKINTTNDRYKESVTNSASYVDKKEDTRMSCEHVSKKIYNIANKNKLPAQKIIGAKYRVFYFFYKILPIGFFSRILNKIFNK